MAQFSLRIPDKDVERIDERTKNRSEWIREAISKQLSQPNRTQLGDAVTQAGDSGLLGDETVRELIEDRAALRARLESKDELLADRGERIEALERDKRTLDARLSEANDRLREANAHANALVPAETNERSRGLLTRLLGR